MTRKKKAPADADTLTSADIEQIKAEFARHLKVWRQSTCRSAILEVIESRKPEGGWELDKVVCLGSGSCVFRDPGEEDKDEDENEDDEEDEDDCSMLQIACAIDLAAVMKDHDGVQADVQILAQDPLYTLEDIALLAGYGVTVLQMDESREDGTEAMNVAKDHLGPRTLLFEFGVPKNEQMCSDLFGSTTGLHIGMGTWVLRDGRGYNNPQLADAFDDRHASYSPFSHRNDIMDADESETQYSGDATALEKATSDFAKQLEVWRQSKRKNALLDIIDSNKPEGGWHFKKIVCLGSGTLLPDQPESCRPEVCRLQMACAIDLASELESRGHSETDIQVLAQDPRYYPGDVTLLTSYGVEVLEMDRALEWFSLNVAKNHLGPRTLLFDFAIPKTGQTCDDLHGSTTGMHIGMGSWLIRGPPQSRPELADQLDARHASCKFPPSEWLEDAFWMADIHWPRVSKYSQVPGEPSADTAGTPETTAGKMVTDCGQETLEGEATKR